MYRTVTRWLGLSVDDRLVEGAVVRSPPGISVVDHAASRRRTSDGTHLAVTVRVRNDGDEPRPTVPVRVTFYESRWLGLSETALEPVARATDRIDPGETATVEVGWNDAEAVSRYEIEVEGGTEHP